MAGTGAAGLETARLQRLERLRVGALTQLQLPDADPVEAGRGVVADVLREARTQGRDLGDGEPGCHRGILSRRLTSDQGHRKVCIHAASTPTARRSSPPPDDGGVRARAAARGDHPRRAPAGTPLRLDELARSLGHEHLADPRGRAPARGARARQARAPPGRQGARFRRRRAARPVRGPARAGIARGAPGRRAVHRRRRHDRPLQLTRFDDTRAAGDVRETMRAHTAFHFTLYDASGSAWLVALIRPAWDRSERFRPALLASEGDPQDAPPGARRAAAGACIARTTPTTRRRRSTTTSSSRACSSPELGGRGIFER